MRDMRRNGLMSYSPFISELIKKLDAKEGDTLSVRNGEREYVGTLMPHHEFSLEDIIILKLSNGYNIGIRISESSSVTLISKGAAKEKKPRPEQHSSGKTVSVLGTGGTIASYVDYRTGAVHPALSAGDLVAAVPEIKDICDVKAEVLFSIFSENMNVENWQTIAEEAADRINAGAEGCIIPHGTDTMGYTSAALAFMLGDLPKPVVLVGAQRSSDRPSSDAYTNLVSAARFIVNTDASEVFVLMHASSSDSSAAVHRGTKVRKMHTSRRDAFKSVNSPVVATVDFEGGIDFHADYRKKSSSKVCAQTEMETNVALLQYFPGMGPSVFSRILHESSGVVISGTGLGHVSSDMAEEIKSAVQGGTSVVMTSQCLYGRTNLNVYNTGRDLISAGVIPGEDMLPETAYVKLMWVLAQTSDADKISEMMRTNLRGEISDRRDISE